jgi:hypothetical protein
LFKAIESFLQSDYNVWHVEALWPPIWQRHIDVVIVMLLYVDDIAMLYPKAISNVSIEVKARVSDVYKTMNLGPACQFFGIEIYRNCTRVSLRQKSYIIAILRPLNMEHTYDISTPVKPKVILHLAEDWGGEAIGS